MRNRLTSLDDYLDLQDNLQNKNQIPANNTGIGNLMEKIDPENIPPELDLHLRGQIKDIPINSTPSQPDYGYHF